MGYLKEMGARCSGMTDMERQYREELFELLKKNPDLPVVPMVDCEIICEDSGRWLGAWGSSHIGEYLLGEERVYFRDDDDQAEVDRLVTEKLGSDASWELDEDGIKRAYGKMPWIKAIIVNIDLP